MIRSPLKKQEGERVERGEWRLARDGLEDLRVLMDALLAGRAPQGRNGEGPGAHLTRAPGNRTAKVAGDRGRTGTGPDPGEIRCLNPQTLKAARGAGTTARLRVERYYHRGRGADPPVRIFLIPRTLRGKLQDAGRRVILNVEVRKRDWDPEGGLLRHDAAGSLEETPLRRGNGSSPGEAEA